MSDETKRQLNILENSAEFAPYNLVVCDQVFSMSGDLTTTKNDGIPSVGRVEFGDKVVILKDSEGRIYAVPPSYFTEYVCGEFEIIGGGLFLGHSAKKDVIACVNEGWQRQ